MTKVLLVEDDKSLREIYAVRLVEEGYDIVSAGDGEEALAMAIKERPGLIISDVMMPKISGFDMLDILRSTTETKDIRVIMMTALSSEDQRERGVSLGADRYLVKSQVGIEDVVRTVHEVLADAPVVGQTPLMTAAAPVPVTPAAAPVLPGPGAQVSTPAPVSAPNPISAVQPTAPPAPSIPSIPAPTPMSDPTPRPAIAPVQPSETPVQVVPPQTPVTSPSNAPAATTSSVLPQPTAPFSTPRTGTLAGRVIEPLKTSENTSPTPSISTMMENELSGSTVPAQPSPEIPTPPTPSVVATSVTPPPASSTSPTPVASIPVGISFEETPRPSDTSSAIPAAAPAPMPQPPVTPGSA